MNDSIRSKTGQSAALLVGILLTIVAVVAHRFLPERRLVLNSMTGATYFLMHSPDGPQARVEWVDQARFHYTCQFAADVADPSCSFTYLLYSKSADIGTDLSRYRTLKLGIRYSGNAHYVRVSIRNFDSRFSRLEDSNSSKYNYVNLAPKDLAQPLAIGINEFAVPEWWQTQYDLPRSYGQPDLGNATAISIDLLGELGGSRHDIQIDSIEFVGDWISAEAWYLGILCAWMILAAVYGASQLLMLRRMHREQRREITELADSNAQLQGEKEKYQKLSTLDALTRILNRHGIEQFIESLRTANLPTSVIVIDLDHFKRVNDQRGHHIGDRVLQTVGEILRAQTRNTDGLGRWGGEEFVLVCPGATLARAADLAEKLRRRILETNFIAEDPLSITASFGVATTQPGQDFEDVFQQADQALYLAKGRGRNCVVAATDDQMHKMTGARKGTWALLSGRFKLHK
ncbi:MAG TPA: GGDEF domain-containing protein [Povalibacter sp.]|nr:GGDEF domain-containing protein [Povalibacter sp.]